MQAFPFVRHWPLVLSIGAAAGVIHQALALHTAVRRGRRIALASRAFEHRPAASCADVLLLGDSTGVGVGAAHPRDTLTGLMAQRYPGARIVNRSRNGARVADLLAQFDSAGAPVGKRWDLVLVLAGGNDVMRLTPRAELERDARRLLRCVVPAARRTVWMGSANIGSAPVLHGPLAWWASVRTRRTMHLLARTAQREGVPFIDFWRPLARDAFGRDTQRWFAADGVHPSTDSYRHCFTVLARRVPLASLLAPARAG